MVEFAIVLPVLVLLVFGIVQFGILFNHYVTLTDAVRATARQAAVARELEDRDARIGTKMAAAAANLDGAKLAYTVDSSWVQGEDVTVSATYPYEINILGLVVKSGLLTSTTTERVE
jgi:Flp pilus assembly protein TadG